MTGEAPSARPRREDLPERRAGYLPPKASRARLALFLFADGDLTGGVERAFINLASGFVRRDVDTTLVVTGSISRNPVGLDQRVAIHELNRPDLRGAFRPFVRYLRRGRPTAVLSAMEHPNLLAVAARFAARTPMQLTLCTHNHLSRRLELSYGARDRLLLPRAVRAAYPRADVLIAASQGVASDLSRILKQPHRVLTIPNPIVDHTFAARMDAPVTHPWLGDPKAPVFLAAGRLATQKDYPTLLHALALVRESRDARLIVLGTGPGRSRLIELSRSLSLDGAVDFHGQVADPLPYMRHADAFVLSSIWEGFSNVLVESLACGCPVVSTDCPSGPAEILGDGAYGRLVPVGDHRCLADAMLATVAEEPDRERLVARAHGFHIDTSADRYLAALGVPSDPASPK